MQSDPLQQLRDIHLPPDPSWWPLAPGWCLLSILLIVALVVLARWALARWRSGAPRRQAAALHAQAYAAYRAGETNGLAYADTCNAILKRLFVHAHGYRYLASAPEEEWLRFLDGASKTNQFTQGPGAILGNGRFQANPEVDGAALSTLMRQTFKVAA